jgi:hypothetical protein
MFKNHVCWRYKNVQHILNIEATQSSDYVFLATHHPIVMKRGELIKGEIETTYNEQEFLRDFLAPDDFAFVPVLGGSGTGKSHLIRWLAANIKSTTNRKVLLIPKLGTNLKDIIGTILNLPELQGDKFDNYRNRLNEASSSLTEGEARQQLLNQLAIAVGDNSRRDRSKLTDAQKYLIDELNSILYDPFFRQHWLKDGEIIHRLITHILGSQKTVDSVEERRKFKVEDLPMNILNVDQLGGKKSRDFYSYLLGDDDIQKETVDWLNQHLDEAISQVLNLGREDLQIIMREVRQTLAEKDIELILLIEDFAKFQGIDRELLEAVLARPQQVGTKPLCAIRTALACTSGYFGSLVGSLDTVLQRVTFSVNLDVGKVGEQSLVNETSIQQFVARYLNVIRQEEAEIQTWAEEIQDNSSNSGELASVCDGCEHRQACHTGFGDVNGIGLYPFTPQALRQMEMLSRVNSGDFNPRILLKDVLKYTLENSILHIQEGRFPSVALREHFGKSRLSAIVQDDIKIQDPSSAERRQILIDLWTDSDTLCDLSNEVHTAFNLPPLGVKVKKNQPKDELPRDTSIQGVSEGSQPDPSLEKIPERLGKQLEILNTWNNQGILPQEVDKNLREFIYPAVTERIEWDTEILLRGSFAGNSQIFKQRNVIFHSPRVTRGTYAGITLSLPLNPDNSDEFRETAIAFQGILQYSHYKHWKFPDGDRYFRAYAKQLELWSQYVLEQVRCRPRQSAELWNPIPAAVELLAIAARMSGHSTSSIEDLINAVFLDLEDKDLINRTKAWKDLFKVFQNNQDKLLEIVKSRIACTKGTSGSFQIIDALQLLSPLKDVRKDWQPQCDLPNDLNGEYQVIQDVRQKVDELLIQAVEEERDRQLNIYQNLKSEFGEDVNKKEVIDTVKQAIEKARDAAIFGQSSSDNLVEVMARFQRTPFSGYMETMKKIEAEIDAPDLHVSRLLQYLSENHQKAMNDASEFLKETDDFLNKSTLRAQDKITELQSIEGKSIDTVLKSIQTDFTELQNLLEEIKQ